MKQICAALNAEVLHLLVPSSLETIETVGNNLRKLLPSLNLRGLRLALEIRGEKSPRLPSELLKTMQEHDVVHCVDVSRGEMPKHETDILYTRLFGRGEHNVYQPTDVELQEIDNRASKTKSEKIVMSFHFVKMYKDAARFKTYRQTGKFPMLTRSTGLASLEEVLKEDTRFPTTRQELIRSQGWKVFDLSETEKIRAADMLNELPEGTYGNLGDVMDRLRTVMR